MPNLFHRALLAASALLVPAVPALAQSGNSGEGKQLNYFKVFFGFEGDVLGLIVVWVLVLLSAFCVGYILKLMLDYRRSTVAPEDVAAELEQMLSEKRYREAIEYASEEPSYLGKLVSAGLNEASSGFPAMERAVEETADAETTRMLRPIEILNVIGNISPMMGLFGTVYGMIVAFFDLVRAGGRPDPVMLASGISTALVTTLWGLIVAMPCMLFYALIRNKIDALTAEGLLIAEDLIRPFKPSAGGSKKAAAAAGSSSSSSKPKATPKPEEG